MGKHREDDNKRTQRITMPDEVDLSTYNHLDVIFTNGRNEIFNLQFRREADGSAELAVNFIGPTGDVATAITLFDLQV